MGKLGPRLASRKKTKRWRKGQSSSSNPAITKHREQSAGMFFKDLSSTPGITKEELRKHDAIQGIQPEFAKLNIDEDQPESTIDGTMNTFDTFATNYSNCSNVSFNRFLSHFQSNSIMHKEMLAVLSAVTEIIKQNDDKESSTEYFAALMSTLETVQDDISVAATLSLLGMSLKTVPKNVLNVQFDATSQILLQILSTYATTENFLILRHCISCLSMLLRAQEAAIWVDPLTIRVLETILSFTTHSKPKVRKSAQHAICVILKSSYIMKIEKLHHPAVEKIAMHCINACELGSSFNITAILHTLTLLKDVMHQLPKLYVKIICERLLSIMMLKNVLITSCCLQTLHGLFVSRPSEATLPLQTNMNIIKALYDYQPSMTDTQLILAWLAVMQEAHCNLVHAFSLCPASSNVESMLDSLILRILQKCTKLWLSKKMEVISGVSHTIKIIIQECVAPLCENEERIKRNDSVLIHIVSMMHKTLSYHYLEAWHHIFHLIVLLFQIFGKLKLQELLDIVKSLGELRDSYNFAYNNDIEYAMGAAIRAMGPQAVLNVLPLQINNDTINLKRSWLIPLLKDYITGGTISFFKDVLLPIILLCEEKSKESINGKTYEFLISQIWSILPSICNDASDVKDNFQYIAKLLGLVISDQKNLRLPVMTALRKLIEKATQNVRTDDIAELARFAKNYLPILFNLYTTQPNGTDEEGQRLAALDTIKIYMTITNNEMTNELFERALDKLDMPNSTDFFKESVADLIRVLIGYTDVDKLTKYYDMCVPIFKDEAKQKEQKKAYRFLEEICSGNKEICRQFLNEHRRKIQKMLISSATSVNKTSRGVRLRCLMYLVKMHPQLEKTKFLEAIMPEAVLCVKDINERCRTSAYQLINVITEKFLSNPEHLKDYTDMLMVGLGGEQKYVSATLLALASITYHYRDFLNTEIVREILEHACTIMTSPTREIVESALSYVKVYIGVMSSDLLVLNLPRIVSALSQMNNDCKRHFRQKVRDIFMKLIRKFGIIQISNMVPTEDVILHKRLKNINKIEDIKKKRRDFKRAKKLENNNGEEFNARRRPKSIEEILADSDEEFDIMETEETKKKKKMLKKDTWIQENEENIVDFIDPAAARNITTTQPGVLNIKAPVKKEKDHGFKIAPDGRLIIRDDNADSGAETRNKKKEKVSFLQSDSENDYEDEDDVSAANAKTIGRKRKYNESVSDVMNLKSQSTSRYRAGGSGIHRPLKTRKIEHKPGSEYRTIKAGGDIKKKGKPDPYAYLPLTRSVLNKRKKKKNAGKFRNIVSEAR